MLMLRVANLKAGLANLATGVTEEEAEALWKTFDADGDGTLDLAELQALFTEQATTAIQSIYARIASYADALSRSKTVDELLDKFDADGDGKVQKSEFIKLAVTGVKIPTD
jgi:Ca2+-binding EF-hand superfamily protein